MSLQTLNHCNSCIILYSLTKLKEMSPFTLIFDLSNSTCVDTNVHFIGCNST